ncbi:6,7-dimethyl-8-ribityllumazine synthase [bacterium]|nr:6,7-dimethyl-8-ribityllumazine synthase [bacterium]NCQ55598.1 6,7-dimethyl-8-ribityllumazine synthase [Candidatus Parcubacteria bacterium]NCS67423.1 6,7-dimethyl-8-ribityllumazine synthase [Candidatus Peregrinibacteria bacterium]NCS96149.1 6,7-dimethyl-8-ribityllumazine synthase [bacterium]
MNTVRIAFIQASWHQDIVGQCRDAFIAHVPDNYVVEVIEVPGSLEMPLMCKKLAETHDYDVICCAGFVTDGGIYRHEFVAHAILQGFVNVQLQTGIPVLSAVLTPKETFAEDGSNPDQHKFFFDHMCVKGTELASACRATVENMKRF